MSNPSLSIVIPAFNEEARIPYTILDLLSYLKTTAVAIIEVIIVDDGSTDRTSDILNHFAAQNPIFQVIRLRENVGKGAALRLGILRAKGEWVLMADADGSAPWQELEHLNSGRWVDNEPSTFVAAILDLLARPVADRRSAAMAHASRYSLNAIAEQFKSTYLELLNV